MDGPYRDPLAVLREAVERKRAQAEASHGALSELDRAMLHDELADELAALLARVRDPGVDRAALDAADRALDALAIALARAHAAVPDLRNVRSTAPEPAVPLMPPPWLIEEPWLIAAREEVKARVRALDDSATLARWGDSGYRAIVAWHGAPMTYVFTREYNERQHVDRHWLGASAPEGFRALEVRVESLIDKIGKGLRVRSEVALGAADFDDAFFITGPAAFARALLGPHVRALLGRLLFHKPALRVGPGEVRLEWVDKALDVGHVDLVAAVRSAAA